MAPSQILGYLQGISTNVQHERFNLVGNVVLIGRGSACQIQLKDPKVSRQHARLRFNQGVTSIEDLNSAHGTLVNGMRVTSVQLTGGEELTLGDTRFRFEPVPVVAPAAQPIMSAPTPRAPVAHAPQPAIPQLRPAASTSHRWLLFFAGLGIPIILGVIGVATLFALGMFDDPDELPDFRQAAPNVIEPSTEDASSEPPDTAPFTLRPYNAATDSSLQLGGNLAIYYDEADPSEYLYEIPLVVGQEVILEYFYCGTSEAILDEISGSIIVSFEINGELVSEDSLHTEKTIVRETRVCMISRAVFIGMIPGEHEYIQTMNVTEQINDGWETWGPEELVSRILIRVE